MKFNKDILPKWWSIVVWITILLFTQGCYTQLSMFHPEPEIEEEFSDFYQPYSMAAPRVNVGIYAQDGAGQSLGLAYQMMYNRFNGFMGFGNRYNYYNPYYYGGYYNETYTLGGYTMNIPYKDNKTPRTWSRDSKSSGTNLNVTRTRSTQSNSSNNNTYTNSSNVSSTRSSSGGSSSSSSSSSSGGRRATRRN